MTTEHTLLIENGTVITMNDEGQVFQPGYVQVSGDRIAAVGAGRAPEALRIASNEVLDATDMLVLPGMINSHTHLFQTFIRGLADDKPLLEWLKTCIWPVAGHMNREECNLAALVGMIENLRSGATSLIDHQYIHTDPTNDDGVVQAAGQTGVRLLLARGWTDINYNPVLMESPQRIIDETTRLYEAYHGQGDGRVRIEFGPLIPWGCSDETMLKTHALAKEWGVGTHIHVAENARGSGDEPADPRQTARGLAGGPGRFGTGRTVGAQRLVGRPRIRAGAAAWGGGGTLPGQQYVPGIRPGAGARDAEAGHPGGAGQRWPGQQ